MADPFVAEVRFFPFWFAPTGWALCNGQLLPISQNTALFSLLGTYYGGDGKSTFALPNLQGSAVVHQGDGNGAVSSYFLGEQTGTETVTLIQSEIPFHTHTLSTSVRPADNINPVTPIPLAPGTGNNMYAPAGGAVQSMAPQALAAAGGSLPHNNMQPYLTVSACIAMQGVYPPRS